MEPFPSAAGHVRLGGSSASSSLTEVAAQRGLSTMYLYFFQLQAFGSSEALISVWGTRIQLICMKLSERWRFRIFKPTTRFLLHVFDSDGEFGWQLERAGLSGEGLHICGDSGPSFSLFDPDWQGGKTPGLREPPTSSGSLQ